MRYKIYVGDEKCTNCGRPHKKVFEIDGKPYGSSCANEILGSNLTAPLWLYELAEHWVQAEANQNFIYTHIEDCSTNFINYYGTNLQDSEGDSKVWTKSIKLNDKTVKIEWQHEINDYIVSRYNEIKNS
jgi:hypothetical protein